MWWILAVYVWIAVCTCCGTQMANNRQKVDKAEGTQAVIIATVLWPIVLPIAAVYLIMDHEAP